MPDFCVIAIVAAFNEADIIEQVVADLIGQGVSVYFLDDGSTDGTVAIVEPYVGRGVLAIEHLREPVREPASHVFHWEQILLRKAQLARELDADWFMHHDADELRESPWPHLNLHDAIQRVDALGFNAIDFASLDFWPVDDRFQPGDDVRAAFPFYADHAPYDRVQVRCWKKTAELDLASSGGHDAQFPGRTVFPLRFVLRHYPIRSQSHGTRKIFEERRNRFLEQERARGWHVQYDDLTEGASLLRDAGALTRYDPDDVRLRLTLRHRGVEALETSLCQTRDAIETLQRGVEVRTRELAAATNELEHRAAALAHAEVELAARAANAERLRAELGARTAEASATLTQLRTVSVALDAHRAEIASVRDIAESRGAEIERLRTAADDAARRLAELHRSSSWRWMAPARAVYRMLGLGRAPRAH